MSGTNHKSQVTSAAQWQRRVDPPFTRSDAARVYSVRLMMALPGNSLDFILSNAMLFVQIYI
jgi:hypothetical protein